MLCHHIAPETHLSLYTAICTQSTQGRKEQFRGQECSTVVDTCLTGEALVPPLTAQNEIPTKHQQHQKNHRDLNKAANVKAWEGAPSLTSASLSLRGCVNIFS